MGLIKGVIGCSCYCQMIADHIRPARRLMGMRPSEERPMLITYKEAAKLMSVSLITVRRMADRGDLERVMLTPGTPRISMRSVEVIASRSGAPHQVTGS